MEAVMPKGVEHPSLTIYIFVKSALLEAVMPKGVEHAIKGGAYSLMGIMLLEAVMPKGVEHSASQVRAALQAAAVGSCDAERR